MNAPGWDSIYGQKAAVASLRGALHRGRIGHAYLFSGPPGVGRRLTATVFAAALLCAADDPVMRPCGRCPECDAVARKVHPDLYRLQPVDDKILIDQVRALQQRAGLKTVRGRYKVFIVENVSAATEQAQNALLKVLEEPQGDAVFILTAEAGAPPLPTIVSRCLTVRFGPLTRDDAARVLHEKFQFGDGAALAAALGGGTVALAQKTDGDQLFRLRDEALALLRGVLGRGLGPAAVQTELWYKERDKLLQLVDFMQLYLRDVLLCQQAPGALAEPETWLINFDRAAELEQDARRLPAAGVVRALDAFVAFRRRLAQNVGVRQALSVMFLELAALGRPEAS